jgi:methyltransferase family protein
MDRSETFTISPAPRVGKAGGGFPVKRIGTSYIYWMLAHSYFLPGLYMQRYSTQMGLSLMASGQPGLPRHLRDSLLHGTLDSTRYLEFDFVWKSFPAATPELAYLDLFSPWQLPVLLVHRKRFGQAAIVQPTGAGAASIAALVRAAGRDATCQIVPRAADLRFADGSFDVITCIAGLAAQRDDRAALARMWRLLRPGGVLFLSLPCAREAWRAAPGGAAHERGTRHDRLALHERLIPHERIYDSRMLNDRIIAVAGEPVACAVFGETRPAGGDAPAPHVANDAELPLPSAPLKLGREWRCYPRIDDLPGAGVVALRFVKPVTWAEAALQSGRGA